MSEPDLNSYDEIPYDSYPFSSTHPDNLAGMATLFGMAPADVNTCRVLELGCAGGGNLIPMAESLPNARFHGIDLSQRQIEQGQGIIETLGLQNVTLEQHDILSLGSELGSFDYIICHGVYSWVPAPVQQKIIAVCREHLVPQGVAYVSYNTYPGWHLRAAVREMMNYHARRFEGVQDRIDQARALLDFLSEAVPGDDGAYGMLLRDELEILRVREDTYLFHEHLEECNEPVYFYRFMEHASAAGLRYLGEARLEDMLPTGKFAPEVETTLREIAPDIIHMEQYLDFLRNRMFRRTLLCHEAVELQRKIDPEQLLHYYISSPLTCEHADQTANSDEGISFRHPGNSTATVYQPLEQAALLYLQSIWPRAVRLEELAMRARDQRPQADPATDEEVRVVSELVLNCVSAGLMELRLAPARFTTTPGPKPLTAPLARMQARDGPWVTNKKHESIQLDDLARRLLCRLDGQRDRAALLDELVSLAERGEMVVKRDGEPLEDSKALREILEDAVEQKLSELAQQALLVS